MWRRLFSVTFVPDWKSALTTVGQRITGCQSGTFLSRSVVAKSLETRRLKMSSSDEMEPVAAKTSVKKKGKQAQTVEEQYVKLKLDEQILLRPDTYIGSIATAEKVRMRIVDLNEMKIIEAKIDYVPGLYKIFDEIVVNAADNKQRDPKMDRLEINIDQENNVISVFNNGRGIPITKHAKEKVWIPTMIFGHLLTSSNYQDDDKKVVGGRNGYGAKLCNLFSTKFVIETACKKGDGYPAKIFKQTWEQNMKVGEENFQILANEDKKEYTKVTFQPDLRRFNMEKLDDHIAGLMARRAFDLAGTCKGVKVKLNTREIKVNGFDDYVKFLVKDAKDEYDNPIEKIAFARSDPIKIQNEEGKEISQIRWEVACVPSTNGEFQQVSFVNSIATTKGGQHVNYIADQIADHLITVAKKKNKSGTELTRNHIKQHMWVFVNCLIENPTFDSQTKEFMTLAKKSFGSTFKLPEKFCKTVASLSIAESAVAMMNLKAEAKLQRAGGTKTSRLKGIVKLMDANQAGSKHSKECTLILTEGDSAKCLVEAGFAVVGRDRYGVFPLRGKLLNVRDATSKQLTENKEIEHLVKILGLDYRRQYTSEEDFKRLRYGRLMIMTDQDQDGSHIKGLLINFLHAKFPNLLRRQPNNAFLEEFITPIVKVTRKIGGREEEQSFYSLPEFEQWKSKLDEKERKGWKEKYYKGLGTSTAKEAKEYFNNLARHRIKFGYSGQDDDNHIDMAFSKKRADDRKNWLTEGMRERTELKNTNQPPIYLYQKDTKSVTYTDFVNKELYYFSNMDNERSIPSMVDGLKPGQRKVMFTCFKRNDKKEVKVAQLAGSVGEASAYHHGEQSLMSTIVGLAQDFVGSNNINLLQPRGQFGTRNLGGKDSASPRYIFTLLSPTARALFHKDDMPLLNYLYDDNQKIEPEWYCPIIPMVLVNGAEGIGTGWSTKIPNYNPEDIINNIRRMLNNEEPRAMLPWFRGFRGQIQSIDAGRRVVASGVVSVLDEEDSIEITELPVRTWTQSYKESVIEPMLTGTEKDGGKGKPQQITDYREYHTDATVRFVVRMQNAKFREFEREGFHKVFKLQSPMALTQMVLFDANGQIKKYDSAEHILKEFYVLRLKRYEMRKEYLVGMLAAAAKKLMNQARFIVEKIDKKISIENKKRTVMIDDLIKAKYDPDPELAWKKSLKQQEELEEEEEEEGVAENEGEAANDAKTDKEKDKDKKSDYDYLLGMRLWALTLERKEALLKERDDKIKELEIMKKRTPKDLWNADLDALLVALEKAKDDEHEIHDQPVDGSPDGKKPPKGKGGVKGRGKKSVIPNAADTLPAKNARLVEPVIDAALILRLEKANEAKERKEKGEPAKKGGKKKKEVGEDGESMETSANDSAEKPKKNVNGKDTKKTKQTTLDGVVKKTQKKKKGSDDEESDFDSENLSDDSEEDNETGVVDKTATDDEYDFVEKLPEKKNRKVPVSNGPSTSKKVESDDDDIQEITEVENAVKPSKSKGEAVYEPKKALSKASASSKPAKDSKGVKPLAAAAEKKKAVTNGTPSKTIKLVSSDEDDSDDEKPPAKKAAPSKASTAASKPAVVKKPVLKRKALDSGSDDDEFQPSTSTPPKKQSKNDAKTKAKAIVSDSDEEIPPPRARVARAAAVRKILYSDNSIENLDDDDDYLNSVN